MPKYDEREGNSCHIHISLWDDERSLFPDAAGHGRSPLFSSFLAGILAHLRELTLFLAPNVNSYKRFQPRLVRADGAGLGRGQPHLRASGSSGTATACGSSAGSPAATRIRTWRSPR